MTFTAPARSRVAMRVTDGASDTLTYLHGDHGSSPFCELLGLHQSLSPFQPHPVKSLRFPFGHGLELAARLAEASSRPKDGRPSFRDHAKNAGPPPTEPSYTTSRSPTTCTFSMLVSPPRPPKGMPAVSTNTSPGTANLSSRAARTIT